MNKKTYHWCKWHKAWVENDPEGKVTNGFILRKKLVEEHKTGSKVYAQSLKEILMDLHEKE